MQALVQFSSKAKVIALWVGAVAGALLLGYLTAAKPSTVVILAAGVGMAAAACLSRRHTAVVVGLLVIAYVNGLPFVNLHEVGSVAGALPRDLVMVALFSIAGLQLARESGVRDKPMVALFWLLGVLGSVWALAVVRGILAGGDVVNSFAFGRDMLAILFVVPVAIAARDAIQAEALRRVVVAAGVLYCLGMATLALGGLESGLIHENAVSYRFGIVKIWADMEYMASAALLLALGGTLYAQGSLHRRWYLLASAVLGLGAALSLVRANYLALTIGLLAGAAIAWSIRRENPREWHVAAVGISTSVLAASLAALGPRLAAWTPLSAISERFGSTADELVAAGGTFGYRVELYRAMIEHLDGQWVAGLGFLHPEDRWFDGLPAGSIRNPDIGVLSVVMTQGLLGLVAIFTVLAMGMRYGFFLVREDAPLRRSIGWSTIVFGFTALISAPTLLYVSDGRGLAATAVIVGLAVGQASSAWTVDSSSGGDRS